jgi:hypothetical protein
MTEKWCFWGSISRRILNLLGVSKKRHESVKNGQKCDFSGFSGFRDFRGVKNVKNGRKRVKNGQKWSFFRVLRPWDRDFGGQKWSKKGQKVEK